MKTRGNPENLKPCRKGETHNPNGRPRNEALRALERMFGRKWVKNFQRDRKQRKEEVDTWYHALLAMSHEEVTMLAKDPTTNIVGKSKAVAMLLDQKKGCTATVDGMVSRLFGEPSRKVEVEGKGIGPLTIDIIDSRDKVINDMEDGEDTDD